MRYAAALAAVLVCTAVSSAGDTERFNVADSISMIRLTDPNPTQLTFFAPDFKVSPDGTELATVTMRGNLSTGANEYALMLYDLDDVLGFVRDAKRVDLPQAQVVAAMSATSYQYSTDHAIDAVRWLADSRTIAFIGRDSQGIRQAFTVNVQSRTPKQLTNHPHNLEMFDISGDGGTVVYAARSPQDWTRRFAHGYVIHSDWMQDLARGDPKDATVEIRYFALDVASGIVTPIEVEPGILSRVVSVAPNGKRAVIFGQLRGVPSRWEVYESLSDALPSRQIDQEAFGSTSPWLGQFLLVDTTTGTAKPLLDAPAKLGAVVKALWSSDGKQIVLARTFLPLDVKDAGEVERRKRNQSIVAIDVVTGEVERVVDAPDATSDGLRVRMRSVERLRDDSILVKQSMGDSASETVHRFMRRGNGWVAAGPARVTERHVAFAIHQSLNTPPDLAATDLRTGKSRVITDLNPQFRLRSLGRAVEYTWRDTLGNSFTGALVYPPQFHSDQRYPIVLQSSALPFRSDLFLVDGFGGATGAFAARPLANKGILVLQMPVAGQIGPPANSATQNYNWDVEGEAPRFLSMMEGAIDSLSSSGLIDPRKVGLIGFSRTGVHVSYALAFSRYPIAAATLADSLAATPFAQSMMYGIPPPAGMLEFEQPALMGGPFWGEGIERWIDRSPFFHLDRLKTPLRIETYGIGIPAYWDTFALLKRQQRPVEMIHIPRGHHVLITPFSRYTSQQGNVDWFEYWLKNEEDPSGEKKDQYARWRKLRLLNDAVQAHDGTQ